MTSTTPPPPAPPPAGPPPVEPPAWAAPPPPPPPPPAPARPALRRSSDNRVIGGVCGGLAEYTGIDPLLWRIGFVALALAGGSGILVYLLMWLLTPSAPSDPYAVAAQRDSRAALPRSPVPGVTVALLLIVLGVLALLTHFTTFSPGPRGFLGAALLVVGLGLVVVAFSQGRRPRAGLLVLGLILSIALLAVSTTPWHWNGVNGPIGDRTYRPATAADVRPSYPGGVGDETLDLSMIDPSGLSSPVTTRVDHGMGDLTVLVPASADVQVTVAHGLGNIDVFGQSGGGFFPGNGASWSNDGHPEFVLTINAGMGDVEVSRG